MIEMNKERITIPQNGLIFINGSKNGLNAGSKKAIFPNFLRLFINLLVEEAPVKISED